MPEQPTPPPSFDAAGDATRRTWLANERTWLAWVRTGLTATAVALAIGKVVPELGNATPSWPYRVLGSGYALLGVALVAYGFVRRDEVDDAIARGSYRSPNARVLATFAVFAVVLGLGSVVTLLLE
jgi:putative membrane protein